MEESTIAKLDDVGGLMKEAKKRTEVLDGRGCGRRGGGKEGRRHV